MPRVSSTAGRVGISVLAAAVALSLVLPTAGAQTRRHRRSSGPLVPLRPRPVALSLVVQQSVLSNGVRVSCSTDRQMTEGAASLLVPLGSRSVRPGLAQSFAALGPPPNPLIHLRIVLEEELTGYVIAAPGEALELALYSLAQRMVVPRVVSASPDVGVYSAAYSPQRVVLSVVTGRDCVEVIPIIRRYFSVLNARATGSNTFFLPAEPARPQRLQWSIPSSRTPDHYALTLAASIACDLLQPSDTRAARVAYACSTLDRSVDEQLTLGPVGADGVARISSIFAQISATGVPALALDRALNAYRVRYLAALESVADRSFVLGRFALRAGDSGLVNTELDRFESVRVQDIQRVVTEYLMRPGVQPSAGPPALPIAGSPL